MRSYLKTNPFSLAFLLAAVTITMAPPIYAADEALSPPEIPTPLKHYPAYQVVRPQWGVQLSGAPAAFSGTALVPAQGTSQATGLTILAEYQPAFLQSIGVIGIGPSFNVYPIFYGNSTSNPFAIFSGGAQIRYQARFFREQPVVPIAAYGFEYLRYQYVANNGVQGASGAMLISGPTLGAWILLNVIDSATASQMYLSTGIVRTYLTVEWKNMTGSDGTATVVSGGSFYAGLRFEF
jgi:hypothetical protein